MSFLLGWLLTVYMLKQYSRRIGKYKFWILVSIPLFFYLIRYEGIILNYFNLDSIISLPVLGIIYPSIKDAIYTAFINSNIQTTGIFFGFSFCTYIIKVKEFLITKLHDNNNNRNDDTLCIKRFPFNFFKLNTS